MVTSCVIQGFVLGPILYAAYRSDIAECFKFGIPILYADDLKVTFPINKSDIRQSYDFIMPGLYKLSLWSEATGLKFNFSKCFVLHYGKNNPRFTYTVCGNILLAVDSVTNLGVL